MTDENTHLSGYEDIIRTSQEQVLRAKGFEPQGESDLIGLVSAGSDMSSDQTNDEGQL